MPCSQSARCQRRTCPIIPTSTLGWESSSTPHQAFQSKAMATRLVTRLPTTGARAPRCAPRVQTSRQRAESVPAWGSIAEWNFSAPAFDARHWKNRSPSAPRARCVRLSLVIWPGSLAGLRGCQLTAEVECSISNQGAPSDSDRIRSADMARSWVAPPGPSPSAIR